MRKNRRSLGDSLKVIDPAMYKMGPRLIPAGHTIEQRRDHIADLGIPLEHAQMMAIQDRASSIIGSLSMIIERSGDADLVEAANRIVARWNHECNAVFIEPAKGKSNQGADESDQAAELSAKTGTPEESPVSDFGIAQAIAAHASSGA